MITNRIDVEVSSETEAQVIQLIKDGHAQLNFLVALSRKEKRQLPKLGAPYLDFTSRVDANASKYPWYLPHQVTLEMFQRDIRTNASLLRIIAEVKAFEKDLEDTMLLLKSEIYKTSRLYYNAVRVAGRTGDKDAERIATELSAHYIKKAPAVAPEAELVPAGTATNGSVVNTN